MRRLLTRVRPNLIGFAWGIVAAVLLPLAVLILLAAASMATAVAADWAERRADESEAS